VAGPQGLSYVYRGPRPPGEKGTQFHGDVTVREDAPGTPRFRFAATLLAAALAGFAAGPAAAHTDVTAATARAMILAGGVIVVDVREYSEFCSTVQHIPDALCLPYSSSVLQSRTAELPKSATILVVCGSGSRSNAAATWLDGQGYTHIYDMLSGMYAWSYEKEACGTLPVLQLLRKSGGVEANWTPAYSASNPVQDYDLLRGYRENIVNYGSYISLGPTPCLQNDSAYTYRTLSETPPLPGRAYFYLAKQKNSTSWGQSSAGLEETPGSPTCQ
jgi:rhodanese-related sulfurtransferase